MTRRRRRRTVQVSRGQRPGSRLHVRRCRCSRKKPLPGEPAFVQITVFVAASRTNNNNNNNSTKKKVPFFSLTTTEASIYSSLSKKKTKRENCNGTGITRQKNSFLLEKKKKNKHSGRNICRSLIIFLLFLLYNWI